ncbi:hypothetical protein FOA43_001508 [Brettanomyces nanus]|uniref:Uncharacterized protein n=1 Tax=Eeniella nana TaxID=13502 RepID=A0A875S4L7_EENNA|nr:uncharacterized protein FOA43_001508 [Brettanomyces nanus]QPG74184.1 hypothetical protein FOA43_001508 [Brettanomyces nanus]
MVTDSFFTDPSAKRKRKNRATSTVRNRSDKKRRINHRKNNENDNDNNDNRKEDAESEDLDDEVGADIFEEDSEEEDNREEDEEEAERKQKEEEEKAESVVDKRRRLAKEYLADLKRGLEEGQDNGITGDYAFDAKDLDEEIISSRLQRDVAEEKGYVYKFFGNRMNLDDAHITVRRVSNMGLTSISVRYPYLYTTSKDIELAKWDIRDSTKKPKKVKYARGGVKYTEVSKDSLENGHCDEIYACAVSPDGKYVVTGGKDKRLIVWSGENLACLKVLPTNSKKGEVYGLAFRRKSDQLYVACGDLKIRTYSVDQQAQLETLYGHQDLVEDISALGQERCVTVGSRDRTAMLWKIPDETRLTFRGGDSIEKFQQLMRKQERDLGKNAGDAIPPFIVEGSIDCVAMVDDSHFVTGSDNGNVSLWSTSKKKPIFTVRQAHGMQPKIKAVDVSAERDVNIAEQQVPKQLPFWITSIHAIPFSDIFVSGSWNGVLKVWKLAEDLRSFELLGDLNRAKGVVTRIDSYEDEENHSVRIYASLSKEHRLGRWIKPLEGSRNAIYSATIEVKQQAAIRKEKS